MQLPPPVLPNAAIGLPPPSFGVLAIDRTLPDNTPLYTAPNTQHPQQPPNPLDAFTRQTLTTKTLRQPLSSQRVAANTNTPTLSSNASSNPFSAITYQTRSPGDRTPMMQDPYITAINSQRSTLSWMSSISENMANMYTPGFRQAVVRFSDFMNGVTPTEFTWDDYQGKSTPGRLPSNLMVEGKGLFVAKKPDGTIRYTRLGDFKFDAEGNYVNDRGWKVQGYLLGENGEVLSTTQSTSPGANNPNMAQGGPGLPPTTEINMWIDPSNGKFFGKYDEYKIRTDGTIVGMANGGKTVTPLYKISLVNFPNPQGLSLVEEAAFAPSKNSGDPVQGTGEVRSGFLEASNTSMMQNVFFLRQAKMQMDVTSKLISTNKSLLEETLRLIQ